MENQENKEELTIGQLFKVMFGRWKLLLIITLSITVLGTLFFQVVYNKNKAYYTGEYVYSASGIKNGEYIDGTKFDYHELCSLEVLKEVKEYDSSFSNIDVEKMYSSGGIQIEYVETSYDRYGVKMTQEAYTINVLQTFFKNKAQAKAFIKIFTHYPIVKNISISKEITNDNNLKYYLGSTIYESKIGYLESQYEFLQQSYDQLISVYGDITLKDGIKLSEKKAQMNVYFQNNKLSTLYTEINQNGYVMNYSQYKPQLELQMYNLNREYELNEKKLTAVTKERDDLIALAGNLQTVNIDAYNNEIVNLTMRNLEITREIADLNTKLSSENVDTTAFETELTTYYNKLTTYTEEFNDVERELVKDESKVYYERSNMLAAEGGMSLVKSGLLSLFVGLVISCVVNLIVDHKKLHEVPAIETEAKPSDEPKEISEKE